MMNRSGPGELVAFACIPCRHALSPSRAGMDELYRLGQKKRCCLWGALSQLGTTHFPPTLHAFHSSPCFRTGQNSIRVPILAAKPFPEIRWEWWLPKILKKSEPPRVCWMPFASVSFLCFVEDIVALTWNRSRISLVSWYYINCTYA